jgi:hypothetical protein
MNNNTITIPNIEEYRQQIINGSLVLTRTIPCIENFTQQIINGSLVITSSIPNIEEFAPQIDVSHIDELTLFTKDFRKSQIIECKINNIDIFRNKYIKILIYLYSFMNTEKIIQNTTLNILREENYNNGFNYYPQLGVSIQGVEAKRCLREIINIIKVQRYNINIKIHLQNDEIVCFII